MRPLCVPLPTGMRRHDVPPSWLAGATANQSTLEIGIREDRGGVGLDKRVANSSWVLLCDGVKRLLEGASERLPLPSNPLSICEV